MPDPTEPKRRREWFAEAFGELYPVLYGHRDQREAERLLTAITAHGPFPGERVLDLACGEGRYLRALAEKGIEAVGLDLSWPLLQRARSRERSARLVRADMRSIPLRQASFDWVLMMFTSFGYFDDEGQNRQVLGDIRTLLRDGGRLLVDTVNPPRLRETLVPSSRRIVGGFTVEESRRIDEPAHRVLKQVRIAAADGDRILTYEERVRLYERGELETILREEGFEVVERLGDYGGEEYAQTRSPRLILLARSRSDGR